MTLPDLGNHAGFILVSYGVTLVVIIGMIVWVRTEFSRQKRMLADLDARGVRRGSHKETHA